jgi:hypothetical protein
VRIVDAAVLAAAADAVLVAAGDKQLGSCAEGNIKYTAVCMQ